MKKHPQIPLNLEHPQKYLAADFICGDANAEAYRWITSWPEWPENIRMLNIFGPEACGKSHLCHLLPSSQLVHIPEQIEPWLDEDFHQLTETSESQLIFVCDINEHSITTQEEAYFKLVNEIKLSAHFMIFLSREAIAQYQITLPDLRSRLRAVMAQPIHLADDQLLSEVLMKLAADRQMILTAEIVQFIISRTERSFEAVKQTLTELDRYAMSKHKAVTLHLVRQFFAE